MKILNKTIEFQSKSYLNFVDLTDKIKNFVKESGIKNGLVNIQILHTSAGLILNENEPLLIEDFKKNLEKTAPQNIDYHHDNFGKRTVNICSDECRNGHSHCKALHLPANIVLNIIKGETQLGQWQRVFFIELDKARERKVQIQVLGI